MEELYSVAAPFSFEQGEDDGFGDENLFNINNDYRVVAKEKGLPVFVDKEAVEAHGEEGNIAEFKEYCEARAARIEIKRASIENLLGEDDDKLKFFLVHADSLDAEIREVLEGIDMLTYLRGGN